MVPVFIAGWIVGLVWQFAILIYARSIAFRIPDPKLARSTRIIMWGLVIPGINLIFTFWVVFLFERYRKQLRLAAQEARETWAAPP